MTVPESSLDFRVYYTPPATDQGPSTVLVCHHGAGFTGLSFACLAEQVARLSKAELGVMALDARSHGTFEVRGEPTASPTDGFFTRQDDTFAYSLGG